jgi:hypothetical protein
VLAHAKNVVDVCLLKRCDVGCGHDRLPRRLC